jgi:hypothetical protein
MPPKVIRLNFPRHDYTAKSMFGLYAEDSSMFELGLVPEDHPLANFVVKRILGSEFPMSDERFSSVRLDLLLETEPDSIFKLSPNFNQSTTYLTSIEFDEKSLSVNAIKYALYHVALVKTHCLQSSNDLSVLFCPVFGTGVIPTPQEEKLPLRLSSDMIEVRPFYLSKTEVIPFFDSFKDKLEKNEMPSIMEFYNFIYLPELLDRREKKMNPASGGEKTENLLWEAGFTLLLKCRDLFAKHKDIDIEKIKSMFFSIVSLYQNNITPDQKITLLEEDKTVKGFFDEIVDKLNLSEEQIFILNRECAKAEKERAKAEKECAKAEESLENERAKTALYLLNKGTPRQEILDILNINDAKLKSIEKNHGQ